MPTLDPRTMDLYEIGSHLEAHLGQLNDRRTQVVAAFHEFTEADLIEVRLEHAEEILGASAHCVALATQIARMGRRVPYRVRLVFGRPLETLTLADFGSPVLRDLAAQGVTATAIDSEGTTLAELVSRAPWR